MVTCIKCGNDFKTYVIIDGKARNIAGRKKCLNCQPWKTPRYPIRSLSEKKQAELDKAKKYYIKKKKELGITPANDRTRKRKNFLMNFFDGCIICGYKKTNRSIALHHCFGKELAISGNAFNRSFPSLYKELEKCIIVCHNCHSEIHDNLIDTREFYIKFQDKLKELKDKKWKDFGI